MKCFNLLFHVIFLVVKFFNRIYVREMKMLTGAKTRNTKINVTQWHPSVAKVMHSVVGMSWVRNITHFNLEFLWMSHF